MKIDNKKEPFEDWSYEQLKKLKPVKLEIDKKAFDGPFTCCRRKTIRAMTKTRLGKGIVIDNEVWKCPKCGEQYVDRKQGDELDKAIVMSGFLDDKKIEFARKLNYDGHSFFLRFPAELTKKWHKGMKAVIRAADTRKFLVEIEG